MFKTSRVIKKIFYEKRASVEFIETSVVYPIVMILIVMLISFSLMVINKSLALELEYNKTRNLLNSVDNKFELIKNINNETKNQVEHDLNQKLDRIGEGRVKLEYKAGMISNKVVTKKIQNNKSRITSKIFPMDFTRKLDFISFVIDDIGLNDLIKYNIKNIFKNSEGENEKQ